MTPFETLAWAAKNVERIRQLQARLAAEVDRRIASHPDLADLDDWLDDHYGDAHD